MANSRFRFLLLWLVLLICTCPPLQAQRTVGVKWEAPEDERSAIAELRKYKNLGISVIEIQSDLESEVWRAIDRLDFEVYGHLGIRFPTTSTFAKPDSSLIATIQSKASAYLSQPSVTAIGLFSHGAIRNPSFFKALRPIARQIKKSGPIKLYYTTSRVNHADSSAVDFLLYDLRPTPANRNTLTIPQNTALGGYEYSPSSDLKDYLHPFKQILEKTSESAEKPVLLHADWLSSILQKYPQFSETLQDITSSTDAMFPLPKESLPTARAPVLPILLLLIVWGTVAIQYNTSPLYRKSLFRYFTAHKFFIDSIYLRQIRSSIPALLIIFQNATILAASIWVTFWTAFSPLGQEALFSSFPFFALSGENPISFFAGMILVIASISFVNIIWLYVSQKRDTSFTQIATIYAWPLQLNLITGTVVISLFASGGSTVFITAFTIITFIIFIVSFIFASMDTSRYEKSRLVHQFKTSVPYLLIISGLLVWIAFQTKWMEAVRLALRL